MKRGTAKLKGYHPNRVSHNLLLQQYILLKYRNYKTKTQKIYNIFHTKIIYRYKTTIIIILSIYIHNVNFILECGCECNLKYSKPRWDLFMCKTLFI